MARFRIDFTFVLVITILAYFSIISAKEHHRHARSIDPSRPTTLYRTFKKGPPRGDPWPMPQSILTEQTYFIVDPQLKLIKSPQTAKCQILDDALKRYQDIVAIRDCSKLNPQYQPKASPQTDVSNASFVSDPNFLGTLTNLTVQVGGKCEEWPSMNMDEMYTLRINTQDFSGQAFLFANSVWGALRGLETFSQLIYQSDPLDDSNKAARLINSTFILDYPRFSFRGFLIDTGRHFIPLHLIYDTIDAMAYNKMNVLHWHIVDDQAFPYVSKRYPGMSEKGAFRPTTHVYSPDEVQQVIDYARVRGIRVLAEFDTPGHTQSWGKGIKDLLTTCYNKKGEPNGQFGPIDPTNDKNYPFLKDLFEEIVEVFPDQYLHLGGDEVNSDCWDSNPMIQHKMKELNLTDSRDLEEYYMNKLVEIIEGFNRSYIVWQEVFDTGVRLKEDAVIHVWKGGKGYADEMAKVTEAGYRAILSSCWYLNYISYGTDWLPYYKCDPHSFIGNDTQKALVMGGEACMWGEWVDGSNLISRTWPRASIVAERLWSDASVNDWHEAMPRLDEQRCRMLDRGIRGEPIDGPGFCRCDAAL